MCSSPIFYFTTAPPSDRSTFSLHDALPIFSRDQAVATRTLQGGTLFGIYPFNRFRRVELTGGLVSSTRRKDRKSTRLNSSHSSNSYDVFCFKKKKRR